MIFEKGGGAKISIILIIYTPGWGFDPPVPPYIIFGNPFQSGNENF